MNCLSSTANPSSSLTQLMLFISLNSITLRFGQWCYGDMVLSLFLVVSSLHLLQRWPIFPKGIIKASSLPLHLHSPSSLLLLFLISSFSKLSLKFLSPEALLFSLRLHCGVSILSLVQRKQHRRVEGEDCWETCDTLMQTFLPKAFHLFIAWTCLCLCGECRERGFFEV